MQRNEQAAETLANDKLLLTGIITIVILVGRVCWDASSYLRHQSSFRTFERDA